MQYYLIVDSKVKVLVVDIPVLVISNNFVNGP